MICTIYILTPHELWKEIGALGDGVELHEKEMFFSSKLNGQTLTFWRDKERTRKEMLELSPEDEKEINKLIKYIRTIFSIYYKLNAITGL